MEKWIKANEGKLMLLAGLFTLWCFYSVVHQGGSIIPRIQTLEETNKHYNEHINKVLDHTHRYHDGKVRR